MIKATELLESDRAIYDEITSGLVITPAVHAGAILIALANNGFVNKWAVTDLECAGLTALLAAGTVTTRSHRGVIYYLPKSAKVEFKW